jgi:apolipoprotein N-acyltransferase
MLLLLPVLTGFMITAAFPPANLGFLAWIAYIPLVAYLFKVTTRLRAFLGGFVAAAISLSMLLRWIPAVLTHYGGLSAILAWTAFSCLVAVLACYPALACALAKHLARRGGTAYHLLFPAIWVLSEYAWSISPFGGLPWTLAGYSQSGYLGLIQIADVAGIFGVSFLLLSTATAIVWAVVHAGKWKWKFAPVIAAGILIAASAGYGDCCLQKWGVVQGSFRVAMLQGNLSYDDSESILSEKYLKGYSRMAETLSPGDADLLILPESPTPAFFQYDESYKAVLAQLAERRPMGLVFNNIRTAGSAGDSRYFNSAYFMDSSGKITGTYDKIHLVPFGEYLPPLKILGLAGPITKDVSAFSPGDSYQVQKLGEHPVSAVICFEAVFPDFVRRFVQKGSRLIINLTNDAWYGRSSAPYQHFAIARVRAVENRRFLLRATNSGISAVVEPTGRIQSSTDLLETAVCRGRFSFVAEETLYTRYGDFFVFLCAIILCVCLILSELQHKFFFKRLALEE